MQLQTRPPLQKPDLASLLERAILEWPIPDNFDPEQRAKVLQARQALREGKVEKEFSALLDHIVHTHQIDWAIDQAALETSYPLYIDTECAKQLVFRQRSLTNTPRADTLQIYVGIFLLGITIPDQERDELEVDLVITSGADIDALFLYMSKNYLIAPTALCVYNK